MTSPNNPGTGTRSRIVAPSPAAPVPKPRPQTTAESPAPAAQATATVDRSALTDAPGVIPEPPLPDPAPTQVDTQNTSDTQVVRSTGSMAVATLISRITGFIRTLLIGATLGSAVGSAFTAANTLPNMITEIVLGSVLTALVVPVLTRAEKEDPDRGEAFIRRLFTLTFTLMSVVTILAVMAAPLLTRIQLGTDGAGNEDLATAFAYLLLPQIFFYGMFSLFMAILNTKEIFRPGAWAPVVNNLVTIGVLLLYASVPGTINPAAEVSITDPHILLVGLGTTLGVVVQCLIMLPPLRKAKVNLKPLWGLDDRLKQFGGMAVAIVVYVAISQLGLIVTNRIAWAADEGAVLIYSNAWLILQVPYGIVGVALLTAIMPRLSRNAADGDDEAVVRDLTLATKLTFIAIIPIIVFLTVFGPQIGVALFNYGAYTDLDAQITGLAISFSAFTLIPYALVMLHLRVFYAREEAWTPTFIVGGITGTKIVLSALAPYVASSSAYVVILLAAANGFGYITGAVIGAQLLRRKLGPLGARTIMKTTGWAFAAGLVGAAAGLLTRFLLRNFATPVYQWADASPFGTLAVLLELLIVGIVFVVVAGFVLAYSGLPEVQTLGRALIKIPGMSRIIKPDASRAIDTGEADEQAMSQQLINEDVFNSTPAPPPMSAGVVRGPRLVPGAPVSDGRYRLLKDHGNVAGARFWQAVELRTGNIVALTFVDTSGLAPMAPRTPAEAAKTAAEVGRNTRKLAQLDHPALAPNLRVHGYRSGCLIVADWVEGSPLRAVAATAKDADATSTLNPQAVAVALTPVANAVAEATAASTPLGMDNASRMRVSTDGYITLAFPAVLPDSSVAADVSGLAAAIEMLAEATGNDTTPVDPTLKQIAQDARAAAHDMHSSDAPAVERVRDLAYRLADYGRVEPTEASASTSDQLAHLVDPGETVATPEEQPHGFGSRGYSGGATAALVGTAVVFVLLIAGASTYLTGLIGGDSDTAPVNTDSLQGSQQETTQREQPIIQPLDSVAVWQAPGQDPVADNPDQVDAVADSDPDTAWRSDAYPNGLGAKPGVGIALTTEKPVDLEYLQLRTTTPDPRVSIYLVPAGEDPQAVGELTALPRIVDTSLKSGMNNFDLASAEDGLPTASGVIIWFSDLPPNEDYLEVSEINLIGLSESEATSAQ